MAERALPDNILSILGQMQTAVRRTESVRRMYSPQQEAETELQRRLFDPSRGARSEFVVSEADAASIAEKTLFLRTAFTRLGTGPIEEDSELNVLETSRFQVYGPTGSIPPKELLITGSLSAADITIEIAFKDQHTVARDMDDITVDLRIDVLNDDAQTVTPYHSGTRKPSELTTEEHIVLAWCLEDIFAEVNKATEVSTKSA